MARRTEQITITDENSRDHGKTYLITEMPAEQAEWWAFRALQALLTENPDIGDVGGAPLAELAQKGLKAVGKMPPEKSKPLLDEMMSCVSVVLPDGKTRGRLNGDIEELSTFFQLRKAIVTLHTSFFTLGGE